MLSNLFCVELLILANYLPSSSKLKKLQIGHKIFLNRVKLESFNYNSVKSQILRVLKRMLSNFSVLSCWSLLIICKVAASFKKCKIVKDFFQSCQFGKCHYDTVRSGILCVLRRMLSNLFCIKLLILYNWYEATCSKNAKLVVFLY